MKVVLDTNVLVSGLLSPYGLPGEIVRMVSSRAISLCFDARIISEYAEVLARPKFPFRRDAVDALLNLIKANGAVVAAQPLTRRLVDPHDEAFLEVAVAGKVEMLITGNLKHYPSAFQQVKIVSPADFLNFYRKNMK